MKKIIKFTKNSQIMSFYAFSEQDKSNFKFYREALRHGASSRRKGGAASTSGVMCEVGRCYTYLDRGTKK
jgi:hypothetical protein